MRSELPYSAKDLILDLLHSHPGPMTVQGFCKSAEVFGLAEQGVRVALNRLCATGLIERVGRGEYGFSQSAQTMSQEVQNWFEADARVTDWNGSWLAVHCAEVVRSERKGLRRHERALQLRGFRELRRDFWVRPNNLQGGCNAVGRDLYSLGLNPDALVLTLQDLQPELLAEATALWSVREISRSYRTLSEDLAQSLKRLRRMNNREAGAEVVFTSRKVIGQILSDPLLPDNLVPSQPRRDLVKQMQEYQVISHEIWTRLLDGAAA